MQWSKVQLILGREIRDQLRDRRTLFMIAVLPLLLYPLVGMTFLQVAQFLKEHPSCILLVGAEELPESPPLLEGGQIADGLYAFPAKPELIELEARSAGSRWKEAPAATAREVLDGGRFDAVVYFPPEFGPQLNHFRESVGKQRSGSGQNPGLAVPQPKVFFNLAKDKSRVAHDRIVAVLDRWRENIVDQTLAENQVSARITEPFDVDVWDVSLSTGRRAAVWSKVLPFILIIWALTGAFYPAIDLCAGEKERGTLETLLSSPAERSEIVWGKLLTVMLFSMATALLNLLSMALTATFIMRQFSGLEGAAGGLALGPPPWQTMGWLILALIPLSALFSALSLAVATMARSTKEGQYYLMPLLMVTLPLLVLPMLPAAELDLGNSLIPITGVMLLLRNLIEGQHSEALLYALPVIAITAGCCLLAIRWAIDQFNNEYVLFRESERLDLGRWLVHLVRDRKATPSAAEAIACGVVLLLIRFFASLLFPMPETWDGFAFVTIVSLVVLIALPALLMTVTLTRRPAATLLLARPPAWSATAAVLLAVVVHPLSLALSELVRRLYPLPEETFAPFRDLIQQAPSAWYVLLVLAVAPAVCEELAFRGFILSGLRDTGEKWKAIVISSVFFGLAHPILQQSLMATAMGILIGYIAVQTRSIVPCMLFHALHNSLGLYSGHITETIARWVPGHEWILAQTGDGIAYRLPVVAAAAILAVLLLAWFRGLPFQSLPEEKLHDALNHQAPPDSPSLSHMRAF